MILGHKKQWQILKKSFELGRIPHALLFSGQKQLGKKTLAIEFAKLIIGSEKIETHPDFILIKPDHSREIQISQIRELIWKLSLRPYSAPYKVAIIDQAHQMNQEAQNCFLKTLEEPKGKSLLILITEHPEILASTILSRVQKLIFSPVKESEIENYFLKQGVSQDKAEYLLALSSGRPGTAINFFLDEEKVKNQEKLISDLEKISNSDLGFRFQYAKNLFQETDDLKEVLDAWLNYFRGLFVSNLKGNSENKYSLTKLKRIINLIQSTDYLIFTTNINPKLALEVLLMEF